MVILDFSTLSGINLYISTPEKYGDRARPSFSFGPPPPPPPPRPHHARGLPKIKSVFNRLYYYNGNLLRHDYDHIFFNNDWAFD